MESHMDSTMKSHLDLACKKLEQQEKKLEEQEKNLEEQEKNLEMVKMEHSNRMEAAEKNIEMLLKRFSLKKENESFTWNIPKLVSRLQNTTRIYSEPFFLRGYRIVLFLEGATTTRATIRFQIVIVGFSMKRGKFDNELEWPFTGKLHIDWFVGPHLPREILGSVILQPNKAIPRPVSPNETEGDIRQLAAFREPADLKHFCQHYVNAKFVD